MAEFEAYGKQYAKDIVSNARALGSALASEGFDVIAEERDFTASHQILTRHGGPDSGEGKKAAQRLEDCGIITNMNMLPGDTKAMSGPSGLRLGTPELTRIGMGVDEMQDVAKFFARSLLSEEIRNCEIDIAEFKSDFQTVKYAIKEGPAYPDL